MNVAEVQLNPLTDAQRRIWNTELLYPNTALCLLAGTIKIKGKIDIHILEKSVNLVIQNNDALRIRLIQHNNEINQYVEKYTYQKFQFLDFSESQDMNHIYDTLHGYNKTSMELLNSNLFQFIIFKANNNEYGYTIKIHHIISDGVSIEMMLRQIHENYSLLVQSKVDSNRRMPSYIDYIYAEHDYKSSERYQIDRNYWLSEFQTIPDNYELKPYNPIITSTIGNRKNLVIKGALYQRLQQFCQQNRINMLAFFQAIIFIYLYKATNNHDIVIGTNYSNRTTKKEKDTMGMFTSTVALRLHVDPQEEIISFIQRLFMKNSKNLRHQKYPYNELIKELRKIHNINHLHRLFGIAVEYRTFNFIELNRMETEYEYQFCGDEANDLVVHIIEKLKESNITIHFDYRTFVFDDRQMDKLINHFLKIADYMLEHSREKVGSVFLISEEELTQINDVFNNTKAEYPKDKTIHELFEEQAERVPDQIAVVYEGKTLSYKELNQRSNRLARRLRAEGVAVDQRIGIMVERSLEMIVGILGILKAGGAYVPIDAEYPADRICYMLDDSGANLLLTQSHLQGRIAFEGTILCLDESCSYDEDGSNLEPAAGSNDLAYVIYTSGTTGKPKGVMVEHRGLCNLKVMFEETLQITEKDRIVQFASLSFDAACWEIYKALLLGATLYIPTAATIRDYSLFEAFMDKHKITASIMPPNYVNYLNPEHMPSLTKLITGGSASSVELVEAWKDHVKYFNAYGPTEASIVTALWSSTEEGTGLKSVPIGRPIQNHQIYILDGNGDAAPIGMVGELCIGGVGLARGYLNRPELTAEKFVSNRFAPGERMYRTGDLGRWLPDGNIEYLGRLDDQVKIRGYRIEIGEVESALLSVGDVKEATVVAHQDEKGEKTLCAYFVANQSYSVSEIKGVLSEKLPQFMIPSYFVQLEQMPITANGKIDRKALPVPDGKLQTGTEYVAPRNTMEATLTEIWQEVLGLKQIGVKDNFFDLGGNSLKAMNLVANLSKGINVNTMLRDVFSYPTIEQMAFFILEKEQELYIPIPVAAKRDYYPLSSAQKRMYILSQMEGNDVAYNIPFILEIEGPLKREKVNSALKQLIERHESLRTSFEILNGEPMQRVHDNVNFDVTTIELEREDVENYLREFIRPFQLTQAPLLRVSLLQLGKEHYIMMIDMHHIISDAVTIDIFLNEFFKLYEGEQLPELRIQYKDYVYWHLEQQHRGNLKKQEGYWLNVFEGEIPVLDMPADFERPLKLSYEGALHNFNIDEEVYKGLKKIVEQTGSTLYMVLLAAYTILLSKYTGQKDIIVGTPIAGRNHADLKGIVGFFVNTLVIRSYPLGEKTFLEYVYEVKDTMLNAYENQDYPFEQLVEKVNFKKAANRNPLFDTMFAVQNLDQLEFKRKDLDVKPLALEHRVAKFDLTLFFNVGQTNLSGSFEYCTKLFKRNTIKLISNHLMDILSTVVGKSNIKLSEIKLNDHEDVNSIELFELNL